MNKFLKLFLLLFVFTSTSIVLISCEGEDGTNGIDGQDGADGQDGKDFTPSPMMFTNKSSLTPLVQMHSQFSAVEAYSLISSTDVLSNGFRLVGACEYVTAS